MKTIPKPKTITEEKLKWAIRRYLLRRNNLKAECMLQNYCHGVLKLIEVEK